MCAVDQKRSDLSPLQGPLRADRFLTRRPLTNYRKAYGKVRKGTLPELGGNFRLCAVGQKRSFFPRAVPFPLQGPLRADRLTGRPLTGRLLTRRPLTNYRKAYGKLRGGTLPELGGNFRLCAVDQKRSFFPRAVLFPDLLPFQGPFPLTGALTGRPPDGKAPYGQASYAKAPYEL